MDLNQERDDKNELIEAVNKSIIENMELKNTKIIKYEMSQSLNCDSKFSQEYVNNSENLENNM